MHRLFLLFFCLPIFTGILAARPTIADHWLEYITTHAQAIEQGDLSPGNLLFDELADKTHVLLGESTHGTLEYYTWRAAISKALIQHAGFNFIAVEGDWSDLAELDRYVRHLPDHAESARAVLVNFNRWPQWMWSNPVIEELAEWLHTYNHDKPLAERAGIHGIDVYGWGDSLADLPAILETLDPGWGKRAESELAALIALNGDNDAFYRAVMMGQLHETTTLDDIYQRLVDDKSQLTDIDHHAYWQARQKTGLARQAKRHLRKNIAQHPLSWNPRAENFIHTVERLSQYYGEDARGIIWAHNTHIGDARHTPMRQMGMVTIGQQARERFDDEAVYLLGFASEQGTFRAGRQWGTEGEAMRLLPSTPISINNWLHRATSGNSFWLPLQAARTNPRLLMNAGHRAIGVTFNPSQSDVANYVPSNIPLRYDGLLFIRQTEALSPLTR
jgi:erythromycin esterase